MSKPLGGREILVIDDDPVTRRVLGDYLSHHGFRVHLGASGPEMDAILRRKSPDLVILDLTLPGESGLDLARRMRKQSNVPIIMLTGRSGEIDRIIGFELGADDYVVKPFSLRELLSRIVAVLRRGEGNASRPPEVPGEVARFGDWDFDVNHALLVKSGGEKIPLTPAEATLLSLFIARRNQVVSRGQMSEAIGSRSLSDRAPDATILRLRRKLEPNPKAPALIKTVRNAGYMFTGRVTWSDRGADTAGGNARPGH